MVGMRLGGSMGIYGLMEDEWFNWMVGWFNGGVGGLIVNFKI